VPARDGSGIFTNLGIYYGCLIFVPYILYSIIISTEFLFRVSLPYHVGQMCMIILLYLLINIILHFKHQYRFLGPVSERRSNLKAGSKSVLSKF
jgi:hypothetical protein